MAGDKHTPGSSWNEDRPRQAYEMALLGLTLMQMATVMDVHYQTLQYWLNNKPEFAAKFNEGKEIADMKVVSALYQNCFDRYVEVEEVHMYGGKTIRTKKKQFIQGSEKAQMKWLALRQKALWAETPKMELTQNNILNITNNTVNFNDLTTEDLEVAKKLGFNLMLNTPENKDE